jgi:hypothetical protein
LNYSWAFTEEIGGGGWYWTLFLAAILLAGIFTLSHSDAKCVSILKEIKHKIIKRFLSHKMDKGAGNTSPLSAIR